MILSIISAIGNNNEIGKKNALLWDLPADMKHFRKKTSGHTIIMGQKTFESIGRALPNRRNIVLTKDENFKQEGPTRPHDSSASLPSGGRQGASGIEIVYSVEDLIELLEKTEPKDSECFIIGGGQIYKLFMDKADKLYITHVEVEFPDADTFFPPIDMTKWQKISEEKHLPNEKNIYGFSFVEYTKQKA